MANAGNQHPLLAQGIAHQRAGRRKQAERAYRDVLKREPDHAAALHMLAVLMRERDETKKAIPLLRKAIRSNPDKPELHGDLGLACLSAGHLDEAAGHLGRAVELDPNRAAFHAVLGKVHMARRDGRAAVRSLRTAVDLEPGNLEHLQLLVSAILTSGMHPVDVTFPEKLARAAPTSATFRSHLATAHRLNGDLDEAEKHYQAALGLEPGLPAAIAGLAQIAESRGDTDAAHRLLGGAVRAGRVTYLVADAWARVVRRRGEPAEAVPVLEQALASPKLATMQRSSLERTLGQCLEAAGRYDEAFTHYKRANEPLAGHWNRSAHERAVQRIIDAFPPGITERLPRSTRDSEWPILIVGMFRSGTTLTETILDAHPEVHGGGEIDRLLKLAEGLPTLVGATDGDGTARGDDADWTAVLERLTPGHLDTMAGGYLDALAEMAPGAARVTDKMPVNFMLLGLVWMMLPGARVVHCVRDPMDTCLSCYATGFTRRHAYTADLSDLAAAYRQYRRLMDHWQAVLDLPVYELSYERLVREQEAVTRELVDFCGLPWNDACLAFEQSGRVAATPSVDQVRTKMYDTSVGRARHFERQLARLRKSL